MRMPESPNNEQVDSFSASDSVLFRVECHVFAGKESLKASEGNTNSRELKRYVSQNIWSNSWIAGVKSFYEKCANVCCPLVVKCLIHDRSED